MPLSAAIATSAFQGIYVLIIESAYFYYQIATAKIATENPTNHNTTRLEKRALCKLVIQ